MGRELVLVAAVAAAVAIAIGLRLGSVTAEFASGDGGLFWVMAGELLDNGFVPPTTTAYNTGDIPWVYPPIGLYLTAALGAGLDLFRILPAVFAIGTIPAMWLLARALIGDRGAIIATIAYGLAPAAYVGLIAGGGVTRGPGLLFALLTMWAVVRGHPMRAGVLGGLTLLAHPIAAFYAALASGALWLARGMDRRMLIAPILALAIASAWFLPMVVRHGLGPLLAGAGSRDADVLDNVVTLAGEMLNPPNLAFTVGAVGVAVAARSRRWDLLAWLTVTALGVAVVDRWVVIPAAVLAGFAVDRALSRPRSLPAVAMLVVALITAVTGVALGERPEPIPPSERDMMAWSARATPTDAVFAVIGYHPDRGVVEWFPALSGRQNITTWQGSEWVPGGDGRRAMATEVAACRSLACLPPADYYVLRPGCCAEIAAELLEVRDDVYRRPDR